MKKIASGRNGAVYDLGDGSVLKRFPVGTKIETIEREAFAVRLAWDHGLPTPKLLDVRTGADRGELRFETVEGETATTFVKRRPWRFVWATRAMARRLAEIHEIPDTETRALKEELVGQIEKAPHLSQALKDEILADLTRLEDGARLCHFDYHSANVMVSGSDCVVIDWGAARHGPPIADLTQSYMINRVNGYSVEGPEIIRLLVRGISALHMELMLAFYAWYAHEEGYFALRRGIRQWLRPIAAARLADEIQFETDPLLKMIAKRDGHGGVG